MWFSILGVFIYVFLCWALWITRPSSHIHEISLEDRNNTHGFVSKLIVCLLTIFACTLPMNLSPIWNGEIADYRDQYEKIAASFLHGHLYFEEEVNPLLQEMENPYDFHARVDQGVNEYHWDHAYYKGHLYMYFGVVPAITFFVPYLYLTGNNLTTYHATQFYVAFYILGLFLLFHLLARLFFKTISLLAYLSLSVVFSVISVVYIVATPAMYCTAQSAALCFMLWGLLFYVKAVWDVETERQTIKWALFGAICGALAFGCRPTIALANVVALPLALVFFRKYGLTIHKLLHFSIILLPYLLIGMALMWYNNARFDNPLEFGQSYQLTIADQSLYGRGGGHISWSNIWSNLSFCLFAIPSNFNPVLFGVFVSYPILWFFLYEIVKYNVSIHLIQHRLFGFVFVSILAVLLIISAIALFSPFPLPRYRLDFMWLLSIFVYIVLGIVFGKETHRNRYSYLIFVFSLFSLLVCVRQFFYPHDLNFSEYYEDTVPQIVRQVFLPWIGIIV